jgi:hypothetical protein
MPPKTFRKLFLLSLLFATSLHAQEESPAPTETPTATVTPTPIPYTLHDFDGDSLSDIVTMSNQNDGSENELVYRIRYSSTQSESRTEYGKANDIPALGEYTGDSIWDYAVVREGQGGALTWLVRDGVLGTDSSVAFGQAKDLIVSGCDFLGNGRSTYAVVRSGQFVYRGEDGITETTVTLPILPDYLVREVRCGDIDGDKRAELALLLVEKVTPTTTARKVRKKKKTKRPATVERAYKLLVTDRAGTSLVDATLKKPERLVLMDKDGDGLSDIGYVQTTSSKNSKILFLAGGSFTTKVNPEFVVGRFDTGRDSVLFSGSSFKKIYYPENTPTAVTAVAGSSLLQPAMGVYSGGVSPEDPENTCSRWQKTNDGYKIGFVWKPSDTRAGALAVIFPCSYQTPFKSVSVMKEGQILGELTYANFGNPDSCGKRQHWRSKIKAKSFPNNSVVVAKTGTENLCWQIGTSAKRND